MIFYIKLLFPKNKIYKLPLQFILSTLAPVGFARAFFIPARCRGVAEPAVPLGGARAGGGGLFSPRLAWAAAGPAAGTPARMPGRRPCLARPEPWAPPQGSPLGGHVAGGENKFFGCAESIKF